MSNLNEHEIAIALDKMEVIDYRLTSYGTWEGLYDDGTTERDWRPVNVDEVPVHHLLKTHECMLIELSNKERKYLQLDEQYKAKEFEIVYMSDVDFKALYGSTSEKVRKQHAKTELSDLNGQINSLELSINWLKNYIPFLRELVRVKERY